MLLSIPESSTVRVDPSGDEFGDVSEAEVVFALYLDDACFVSSSWLW
jgi:hypothetical protein